MSVFVVAQVFFVLHHFGVSLAGQNVIAAAAVVVVVVVLVASKMTVPYRGVYALLLSTIVVSRLIYYA